MEKLMFLTNELMNPSRISSMRLPMNFIAYGITTGKMYTHYRNRSTFFIHEPHSNDWGNTVVYGALFLCKDFDFYNRILDAYHVCSLSTMLRNHPLDIHHRLDLEITPIHFNTLEDLARLNYREGNSITAQTYVGNPNHPKLSQRFSKRSYRVLNGIDAINFKKLFWEVSQ